MTIELVPAKFKDKPILRRLLELYQYDLSEFNGSDVNDHGVFDYRYLDHYWSEPGRYPYLIKCAGELAGLALIRNAEYDDGKYYQMAEFFVLRRYRRQGIGRKVARQLFERYPGLWRIHQEVGNLAAQNFWREVINEYTGNQFAYVEEDSWTGPIIQFEVRRGEN